MSSKLSNGRTFSKELGLLWVFSINCVGVTKRECLGKSRFSFLYEQVESLKRSIPICMFSRGTEQGQVFLGTRPLRRSGQTGRAWRAARAFSRAARASVWPSWGGLVTRRVEWVPFSFGCRIQTRSIRPSVRLKLRATTSFAFSCQRCILHEKTTLSCQMGIPRVNFLSEGNLTTTEMKYYILSQLVNS